LAAARDGNWGEAVLQGEAWLEDQPFDTEAAILGSYAAAVGLEAWDKSAEFAAAGLRARPHHPTLTNNLAYALIEKGDLPQAEKVLTGFDASRASGPELVAISATRGLLAFRDGRTEEGLAQYSDAIESARRLGDPHAEAMARAMLAREELLTHMARELPVAQMSSLRALARRIHDKGVLRCIGRAEELFDNNTLG
jgi:tetratricopeptide (TPR) repeat protein